MKDKDVFQDGQPGVNLTPQSLERKNAAKSVEPVGPDGVGGCVQAVQRTEGQDDANGNDEGGQGGDEALVQLDALLPHEGGQGGGEAPVEPDALLPHEDGQGMTMHVCNVTHERLRKVGRGMAKHLYNLMHDCAM